MRRREFVRLLGGSAAFWPLAARAQQPEQMRRVGVLLGSTDNPEMRRLLNGFMQSFKELGWTAGRNVQFDIRWSGGEPGNNARQAQALIDSRPEVIFAAPSNVVIALQKETRTIPIIFASVSDPIAQRVVDNLAHPSGNLTGFSNLEQTLMGKWLQLLKEVAPGLKRAALMISVFNAASPIWYRMFNEVAPTLGIEPISVPIKDRNELAAVISSIATQSHSALIVAGDTMLSDPPVRRSIINLVAKLQLPTLYGETAFAQDGGLMAYGIDRVEPFRRAAIYVDRILKGAKPSELPVQQPSKFEFVINLKTAKALGLKLSPDLLSTADEVIE
ncbi:MAG TPA: ABC transporter substrate-binding protein [Candidatus Binataceae bacterium]|nr:ABC transporter substrate-binding protein [Candidatus Binataceae bacterium]